MTTTITGLDQLKEAEGKELGTSDWHEVTQEDINAFADEKRGNVQDLTY